jgi:RNA polymerase sigma-70 factor (ECF subfamily)
MDDGQINQRLSQLSTCWTLLTQAHGGVANLEVQARAALIERYKAAIYRYLLGSLHNPDAADEVFQEFALRLIRGDFHNVDASRGRFRNYVKVTLSNLVQTYRKRSNREALPSLEDPEEVVADSSDLDAAFLENWRKAVLDRAWEALSACQRPGGAPYHDALRLRTEEPELTNEELLQRLNKRLPVGYALTAANLRKVLQRARAMFTDLLVEEVARSQPEELEQELIDLGFYAYCRQALERRRAGQPSGR